MPTIANAAAGQALVWPADLEPVPAHSQLGLPAPLTCSPVSTGLPAPLGAGASSEPQLLGCHGYLAA